MFGERMRFVVLDGSEDFVTTHRQRGLITDLREHRCARGKIAWCNQQVDVAHRTLAGLMYCQGAQRGSLERDTANTGIAGGGVDSRENLTGAFVVRTAVITLLAEKSAPRSGALPLQAIREQPGESVHRAHRARHRPFEVVPVGRRVLLIHDLADQSFRRGAQCGRDDVERGQVGRRHQGRSQVRIESRARCAVTRSSAARAGSAASRRKASTSLRSHRSASL